MPCTSVTAGGGGGGGQQESDQYKLILHVNAIWGDIAQAAQKIANWLSGIEIFGVKFDSSLLGGWEVTQIGYAPNQMEFSFKKVGSLPIVAVITGIVAAIRPILWLLGIVLTLWELKDIYSGSVTKTVSNNDLASDTQKTNTVKDMLDKGYTPEQIAKVLGVLNEDKGKTDWGSIVIPAVALIAAAYVAGELFKGKR